MKYMMKDLDYSEVATELEKLHNEGWVLVQLIHVGTSNSGEFRYTALLDMNSDIQYWKEKGL